MREKVFICSPFRGDMEGNAKKAAAYSRMACEQGYLPIAPHLLFPQFLNEGIEEERQIGILDLCQYFGQKKLKGYAAFFSSSSSFCWGVR